jgi:hypothetical protein
VRDKRSPHHSLAAALIEKLPDLNDPAYPELKGIAMNVCANVYVGQSMVLRLTVFAEPNLTPAP